MALQSSHRPETTHEASKSSVSELVLHVDRRWLQKLELLVGGEFSQSTCRAL